ncbi:MAG: hypothetical protein LKF31_09310 [Muribaculaceae bacterium]|jgi:hypothetical protein|nr:hypothetical protein [Muribaculaceae bacterium]
MGKRENILELAMSVALLVIAITALLPLLKVQWTPLRYIFAAGAAATFIIRTLEHYEGKNLRVKRLHRIEKISALCYCVSAFFMFYPQASNTDWLGFLTGGAVLQVYTSFMIQYAENKELREKDKK